MLFVAIMFHRSVGQMVLIFEVAEMDKTLLENISYSFFDSCDKRAHLELPLLFLGFLVASFVFWCRQLVK